MGRRPHPDREVALGAWEATYGTGAPAYLSVPVMQMAIAYERQCKAGGGLSAQTKSTLRQALRRGWSKSSTHCMPNERLVLRLSKVRRPKAGARCQTAKTMEDYQVAHLSALRCTACLLILMRGAWTRLSCIRSTG